MAINYVVTTKNMHEMVAMVELSKSLEIGHLNFFQLLKWPNYSPAYLSLMKDLMPSTELSIKNGKAAVEKGKELNVKVDIVPNKNLISACHHNLWEKILITLDGSVWPCRCGCCEENRPFVGNIFKDSFMSIWLSKQYKDLRRSIRKAKLTNVCHTKGCLIEGISAAIMSMR